MVPAVFVKSRPFPDLSAHVVMEAPSLGRIPVPFGSEASYHAAKFVDPPVIPGKLVNILYADVYCFGANAMATEALCPDAMAAEAIAAEATGAEAIAADAVAAEAAISGGTVGKLNL